MSQDSSSRRPANEDEAVFTESVAPRVLGAHGRADGRGGPSRRETRVGGDARRAVKTTTSTVPRARRVESKRFH